MELDARIDCELQGGLNRAVTVEQSKHVFRHGPIQTGSAQVSSLPERTGL